MKGLARNQRRAFDDEPTVRIDTIGTLVRRPAVVVACNTPVRELREMLIEHRVPALCVVDGDDNLAGLVTRTDALRAAPDGVAREAMSAFVLTMPSTAPIDRAAALVAFEEVGQIVVVDGEGTLMGLVSAIDLVRYFAGHTA
jgi:CBS-domain-containing membrane protein